MSGAALTGAKAANYSLASVSNATANITARALTISATAANKEYNGSTAANATLSDNRISGDALTVTYTSATFTDTNVGVGKGVTVSGIALSGTDAGNYSANTTATATANITTRPLAVTAEAKSKVFGDTDPVLTFSAPLLLTGDVLSGSLTRAPGQDVGAYAITQGTLANANYAITYTGALLSITARPVSITPSANQHKSYDAPEPVYSFSNSGSLPAGSFTGSLARSPGQDVGSYPFLLGSLSAGGNYSLSLVGSETFSIVPAAASITLHNLAGRVYDGSPKPATYTTTPAGLSGVTVLYEGAALAPTGVGSYAVTASLSNSNYLPATATGTLVILPAPATITLTAADFSQTYDGTAKLVRAAASPAAAAVQVAYRQNNNPVASAMQAGTYAVVATLNNPNYQLVDAGSGQPLVPAQLTASLLINKAPQELVWAAPASIGYGTALSGTQLNAGRPVGDGVLTYSPVAGTVLPAGPHTLQVTVAETDNYLPRTASVVLSVATRPLTPAVTAASRVYDGTPAATLTARSLSGGVVGADDVTLIENSAAFADKQVGAGKPVTATGLTLGGTSAANYSLTATTATTTANITAASLTGNFTAANKTYDGTSTASILTRSLTGKLDQDDVTLTSGIASFGDKNAGKAKPVTASGFVLSGPDAINYQLVSTSPAATADILAKPIAGSFTAADKVYDNTAAATISGRSLSGTLTNDDVRLSGGIASFANAQVGSAKPVTLADAGLLGGDAGNYQLTAVTPAAADITPLGITGRFTVASRPYDGTVGATVLTRTPTNALGSDVVTLSGGTATFADKHVGAGKLVTLSGAVLGGAQAGNYSLLSISDAAADITARSLLVTAAAADKPYDGTRAATVTLSDDRLKGDVLAIAYTTTTFADKQVGTNKTVTVSGLRLSGADADNYSPNATALATASITPLALTISISASDKVYDSNTQAAVVASLGSGSGLLPGDGVTVGATGGQFDSPMAGTGKTVTATVSKTGTDAGNYTANTTAITTASISKRPLTASLLGSVSKVYDRTTTATLMPANYELNGRIDGDAVSLIMPTSGSYDTRQVGAGKIVTVSGLGLDGAAAPNYQLVATSLSKAVGNITARPLQVTAAGIGRIYDGTTTAAVTLADNRLSPDVLTTAYTTATFASKQVGADRAVTVTGINLSGPDAGNYAANTMATTTAGITALGITGTISAANKVYDGTLPATAIGSLQGQIVGDDVSAVVSGAQFNTPVVAVGKPVTAALTLAGADAGNYTVNSSAATTASITAKALTASITAQDKVYDATATAIATAIVPTADLISGDVVGADVISANFRDATATLNDAKAGVAKPVLANLALKGTAAANYQLTSPMATTTATITPRPITGTFTAASKVFDGTTAAAVTGQALVGVLSPDVVSLTGGSASFGSSTVGTGKTVTASEMALSGSAAPNYSLTSVKTTLADITVAVPGVAVVGGPVQYSDNVTLTATISSATVQNEVNSTGGTVQFLLKPNSGAVIALGSSAYPADWSVVANKATVIREFNIKQAPGSYAIQAIFTPNQGNIGGVTNLTAGTLVVTREHAEATYTGETYYTLPSATASSFNILLSTTVKDITALPASTSYDATPGNISNAVVVFHKDNINGPVIGSAPVALVSSTDPKTGTASVFYNCPISNVDQNNGGLSLTIYPEVSGYYTNLALDPVMVTLSLPGADFVTGGGFIVNTANSRGTLAGSTGAKTNFGFTMKYTRSGSNLKGQCNIIVRSNGRVYQIKSNSVNTLSVGATTNGATPAYFNTKANYTDITDPLNPISGGGNMDLTVWMNDISTGGQNDEVGMQLSNGSQLLFASDWNGTKTMPQPLGGGNIQVRNMLAATAAPVTKTTNTANATVGGSAVAAQPVATAASLLEVFPNPMSGEQATVHFRTQAAGKVQVLLYNEVGMLIATLYDAQAQGGEELYLTLARADLPTGLYMCRLLANGRVVNYRFAIAQ